MGSIEIIYKSSTPHGVPPPQSGDSPPTARSLARYHGSLMQLGIIGLGRMGANMVRRLSRGGQSCVVFDLNAANVKQLAEEGAAGATSLDDFVAKLSAPRAIWLMVPAAAV